MVIHHVFMSNNRCLSTFLVSIIHDLRTKLRSFQPTSRTPFSYEEGPVFETNSYSEEKWSGWSSVHPSGREGPERGVGWSVVHDDQDGES